MVGTQERQGLGTKARQFPHVPEDAGRRGLPVVGDLEGVDADVVAVLVGVHGVVVRDGDHSLVGVVDDAVVLDRCMPRSCDDARVHGACVEVCVFAHGVFFSSRFGLLVQRMVLISAMKLVCGLRHGR